MKVLITGGAGFLGSHVADALIARGDEVVVVDHHQKAKRRYPNPKAVTHKLSFAHGDVRAIFAQEQVDVIVHLAAQISVTKSINDPIYDAERNIFDALQLVHAGVKEGVKKVIFASSGGAIYGDHPKRPTPLLYAAKPLSPYGVAKQSFEWYLQYFYESHGVQYVSLRFANLFGPRQQVVKPVGEGNVISLFLDKLLVTGEPMTIFGDGTSSRDFLYVDDAVEAVLRAIDRPVMGVINVGTGKATTVQGLYESLCALHGKEHPVIHEPYRKGEVMHSVISAASAKKLLDWRPKVSFAQGLKATYTWYKDEFGTRSH